MTLYGFSFPKSAEFKMGGCGTRAEAGMSYEAPTIPNGSLEQASEGHTVKVKINIYY